MKSEHVKLVVLLTLSLAVTYYLLSPIIFAAVLAYLSLPLFKALNKVIKNRTASAFLVMIFDLGAVIYPIALIIRSLVVNRVTIGAVIGNASEKISSALLYVGLYANSTIPSLIGEKITSVLTGFIFTIPGMLMNMFILLSMIFFFLRDGNRLKKYLYDIAKTDEIKDLFKSIENLFYAIVYGYFATALMVTIMAGIGFWLLGLEYAIIMAIIVGFAALLPVIGTWMIFSVFAAGSYLQGSPIMALILFVMGIGFGLFEFYAPPLVAGKKAKIHSAIMILGFLGGPLIFGMKGFVLGPMILGTLKIVIENYKN